MVKNDTYSPRYWHLGGVKFAKDQEPMIVRPNIRTTLYEPRFCCGIKSPTPRQRFEVNLRILLKAYLFFHDLMSVDDFWVAMAKLLCKNWGGSALQQLVNTYMSARKLYIRDSSHAGRVVPTGSHAPSEIAQLLDDCIAISKQPLVPKHPNSKLRNLFRARQDEWRAIEKHIVSSPPASLVPGASSISIKGLAERTGTGPSLASRISVHIDTRRELEEEDVKSPEIRRDLTGAPIQTSHLDSQSLIKGLSDRTHNNVSAPYSALHISTPNVDDGNDPRHDAFDEESEYRDEGRQKLTSQKLIQSPSTALRVKRELDDADWVQDGGNDHVHSSRRSRVRSAQGSPIMGLNGVKENEPRPSPTGLNDEIVVVSDDESDSDPEPRNLIGSIVSPGSFDSSRSRKRRLPLFSDLGPSKRRTVSCTADLEDHIRRRADPNPSSAALVVDSQEENDGGQQQELNIKANSLVVSILTPSQRPDENLNDKAINQDDNDDVDISFRGPERSENSDLSDVPVVSGTVLGGSSLEEAAAGQPDTAMADQEDLVEAVDTNETTLIEEHTMDSMSKKEPLPREKDHNTTNSSPAATPYSPANEDRVSRDIIIELQRKLQAQDEVLKESRMTAERDRRRTDLIEMQLKDIQKRLSCPGGQRDGWLTVSSSLTAPARDLDLDHLKHQGIQLCMDGVSYEINKLKKVVLAKLAQEDLTGKNWAMMERLWLTLDKAMEEATMASRAAQ
ncbi:hypothetical protein AAE478_000019 [Parahypoxylon ruwenzoriense]